MRQETKLNITINNRYFRKKHKSALNCGHHPEALNCKVDWPNSSKDYQQNYMNFDSGIYMIMRN